MDPNERIQLLERRIEELEGKKRTDTVDIRALWESIRDESDVERILSAAKAAGVQSNVSRAQIHGMMDELVKKPIGGEPNGLWWTPIVASSEPCAIIVVTVVTITICD